MLFKRRLNDSWNATRLLAGAWRGNPLLRRWNPFRRRWFLAAFCVMLCSMAYHAYQGVQFSQNFDATPERTAFDIAFDFAVGNAHGAFLWLSRALIVALVFLGLAGPIPGGEDEGLKCTPLSPPHFAAARLILILAPLLAMRIALTVLGLFACPGVELSSVPFTVVETLRIYAVWTAWNTVLLLSTMHFARVAGNRLVGAVLAYINTLLLPLLFGITAGWFAPLAWGRLFDRNMRVFNPTLYNVLLTSP